MPLALPRLAEEDGWAEPYFGELSARLLLQFFKSKGLAALKQEDRAEQWYDDWIAFQREHRIYARLLCPARLSSIGGELNFLRLARFLELFAYLSPSHGYSLQVTFLGFFSILMGDNEALKQEAVEILEAGGLLAFGVSERAHGSDLLANEFIVAELATGGFRGGGGKYYIGNSNLAELITVLARKQAYSDRGRARRASPALLAIRPNQSPGFRQVGKIRTVGIRSAHVGEFSVQGHEFAPSDVIAQDRAAWEAVLGTVTLGKFLLGFGAIGICEHAMEEAVGHLKRRILYGKPASDMPHIRSKMAHGYARLAAMKLYAYRALDYVLAASPQDGRYLLFNAVQKAKVSTEGVRVVALLAECMGAKAFESDTYFEMALRDVQLIPALEGSAHINLSLAAQFGGRYFEGRAATLPDVPSAVLGEVSSYENAYLQQAGSERPDQSAFGPHATAFAPLLRVRNVRLVANQAAALAQVLRDSPSADLSARDTEVGLAVGRCVATVAYAQLVAENAVRLGVGRKLIAAMFHEIATDLSAAAGDLLAAGPQFPKGSRDSLRRMVRVPRTSASVWAWVADQVRKFGT
ncbi:MAG TPA: acyl-CoA dehydrogenase family protein [Tepidisphaeraceae bacterium]|nr:acyl-CoA dehydrogenase family protein [Tepidisphaeraceae bacterium]